MIQPGTKLKVADNTGVKVLICIQTLGQSKYKKGVLGDIVIAAVRGVIPRSQVKKKEVVKAVIVRQTSPTRRADGTVIRFDDNAAVVVNADKTPRGTRVFGPVARELRDLGFTKIISQAPEVW